MLNGDSRLKKESNIRMTHPLPPKVQPSGLRSPTGLLKSSTVWNITGTDQLLFQKIAISKDRMDVEHLHGNQCWRIADRFQAQR